MRLPQTNDVNAMGIHIHELKSQFNQAVRDHRADEDINNIHMQIDELESQWHARQWNPATHPPRQKSVSDERKYPHIDEPPPLL
jgi:hypothetical protein